ICSEYGLIHYRLVVEIRWLQQLAAEPAVVDVPPLSEDANAFLDQLIADFDINEGQRVKSIEDETNHDVKAVEYYLKQKLKNVDNLDNLTEFVHFCCTSEDINNLAYAQMLRDARADNILPAIDRLLAAISALAQQYADTPMLSRTHGQAASPTTLGKEMAVFAHRLRRQREQLANVTILGKMNGAVGNYNAHYAAYPDAD